MAASTTIIGVDWLNKASRPNRAYTTNDTLIAGVLLSDSPAILVSLTATNTGAADRYIQVFNSAEEPDDGDSPMLSIKVPAGDTLCYDIPTVLDVGLYVCTSSTPATKTLAAAELMVHSNFRIS